MVVKVICGRDVDVVFAYETDKVVRIRDRRLGFLYWVFLGVIFGYVLMYRVVYQAGYLKQESPVGTVRFSLQRPLLDPACDRPDCPSDFAPASKLPYCKQYKGAAHPTQRPCRFQDSEDIFSTEQRSAFVSTRVTESIEEPRCNPSGAVCQRLFRSISNATYYPAGVEAFTLLLDHSVDTPTIGVHASSRKVGGSLYVEFNDGLCARTPSASSPSAPCTISPNATATKTGLDVFRLSTLLEAASLGLDDSAPGGSSLRNEGAVVILDIEYRNFQSWFGLSDGVTYRYKPSKLDASPYKEVGIAAQNATQRVWRDRHGVKIVALQTGRLGAVDMTTLLVQLTTSLTLLAGATAIVDALALYTMPERKYYRKAKIQVTADFGDLRAQRAAASEALLS